MRNCESKTHNEIKKELEDLEKYQSNQKTELKKKQNELRRTKNEFSPISLQILLIVFLSCTILSTIAIGYFAVNNIVSNGLNITKDPFQIAFLSLLSFGFIVAISAMIHQGYQSRDTISSCLSEIFQCTRGKEITFGENN